MNPIYLSRRSAAKYVRDIYGVRCSEKWLAKLAVTGGGPRIWKNGRAALYRRYELDAWVAGRISGPWTSSSDATSGKATMRAALLHAASCEGMPYSDV